MKGDFSRLTFDRKKHYSDVLMQQGRVLVDADWNEQQRIHRYRTETGTADIVGPSGVPATDGLNILTSSAARSICVVKAEDDKTLKGWIVGAQASILHWDGRALKAQAAPAGITDTLRAVCFVDENHGWAAGDRGTILCTSDGGSEWTPQDAGTQTALLAVYFLKADRDYLGCAVGVSGTLLYTQNGGKNWFRQSTGAKAQLNAAHILPLAGNKGFKIFAVGRSRTILEYAWDIKKNKLSPTEVILYGDKIGNPDLFSINAMIRDKAELVIAAGEGGTLFCKKGHAWQSKSSGVDMTLKAVLAVPATDTQPLALAAVGEDGTVCFSTDGYTWQVFPVLLREKIRAVSFMDCNREQSPATMSILGVEGGIYNQTPAGWGRFMDVITDLSTSAGRIYADGILCEFESPIRLPLPSETGKYLAYVDCWRRHVTAAHDLHIRETALGGPDTCTRIQTIAQVKYLPVVSRETTGKIEELRASADEIIQKIGKSLTKSAVSDAEAIDAAAAVMKSVSMLADDDLTVHSAVHAANIKAVISTQKEKLSTSLLERVKDDLDAWEKIQTKIVETLADASAEKAWAKLIDTSHCALAAGVQESDTQTNPCAISTGSGYTGLENQLYRVEIHEGSEGNEGASFKWSRDNGSVIFPFDVASVNDNRTIILLTAQNLGSYYPVSKEEWIGAWVEVRNDDDDLCGQPGILMRVIDVPSDTEMVLDGSLNTSLWSNKSQHPIIRRWDQRDGATKAGAVPVAENIWIDLESGVQILFEKNGTYRVGNYWMIPARTDAADVEWPQSDGSPAFLPPAGICHHYARLAVLTVRTASRNKTIVTGLHDCRAVFEPAAQNALHVIGINWQNDGSLQFDESFSTHLLTVGFQIILDDAPDAWTINAASVIVTLELPNGLSLAIQGMVAVSDNTIIWRAKAPEGHMNMTMLVDSGILHNLATDAVNTTGPAATPTITRCRVRITLKGGLIWRSCCGKRIYLDGHVTGKPRNGKDDAGDAVIRYDLDLPSGAAGKSSDFESWINLYQVESKSATERSVTPRAKTKRSAAKRKSTGKKS